MMIYIAYMPVYNRVKNIKHCISNLYVLFDKSHVLAEMVDVANMVYKANMAVMADMAT